MARPGRGSDDGWFHLGRVEVTTTVLVVVLAIASFVVWAVEPASKPIQNHLALDTTAVTNGQLWRLLTWPIACPNGLGIFGVIAVALFWYFGTEIERQLGRKRMAWFLTLITVGLGLLWVAVLEASGSSGQLSSLNQLELMVLLVFIAEYPNRRFFFNIPGWVIGVVIIGYSILVYLGQGNYLLMLNFVLGLALTGLIARSMGLMAELTWVPHLAIRRKPKKQKRSRRTGGEGTVVAGPWNPAPMPPVSRDQAELDGLLDKISATGMDSLTPAERDQLMVLRDRLRRR
jgi:membrane associated rhomboid family serine protease